MGEAKRKLTFVKTAKGLRFIYLLKFISHRYNDKQIAQFIKNRKLEVQDNVEC